MYMCICILLLSFFKFSVKQSFCSKSKKLRFHKIFRESNFNVEVWAPLNGLATTPQSTVWKNTTNRGHDFHKKITIFSVESTFLLKELWKSWFHEIFWTWSLFVILCHIVYKIIINIQFAISCKFLSWLYSSNFSCKQCCSCL